MNRLIEWFLVSNFFLSGVAIMGQNIVFPDANFKNYLVTGTWWNGSENVPYDTDGDLEISIEEALNVLEMSCSGCEINNLSGIEYFTNITNLACSYNNLTSLDISGLWNLERFNCSYNNLTSLEVFGLFELQKLSCSPLCQTR